MLVLCLMVTTARAGFYAEATVAGLQEQMKSGQLTSAVLTAAYRPHRRGDKAGPKLNSIINSIPTHSASRSNSIRSGRPAMSAGRCMGFQC